MTTIVSATDLQTPSRPARKPKDSRIRHTWGIHVNNVEDVQLATAQQFLFENSVLPENTKYALVRYALDTILDNVARVREKLQLQAPVVPVPPAPVSPPPVPKTDPVVAALEAQKRVIETRLQAAKQARLQPPVYDRN